MNCPICNRAELQTPAEHKMQACKGCANTVGVVPMPPVTRPAKACSCGGRKFLRCIPREHSAGSLGKDSTNRQSSAPMMLTHAVVESEGWLANGAEPVDLTRGWGWLEVFVCYACGKVEWYCSDVAEVPIHPHLMTDVVDYDASGPYR
jgi:hypothetical protein